LITEGDLELPAQVHPFWRRQTIVSLDLSMKRQDGRALFRRESENGRVRFLEFGLQWDLIANCVFQDRVLTGRLFFQCKSYNELFCFFLKVEAMLFRRCSCRLE